jgi:glycosyltransferase involved in cell wall biosynthesis
MKSEIDMITFLSSPANALDLSCLSSNPLVSVLIPNHNYCDYLPLAIDSVLSQTYQNFEVIICDDGSTDNSWEVLQTYADDVRIKIIRQSNKGQGSAWSTAYSLADGEIICLLDSDDTFRSTKLTEVVKAFSASSESGVCAHFLRPVTKRGWPLGHHFPHVLDQGWLAPTAFKRGADAVHPPSSGICLRREVAETVIRLNEHISRHQDKYLFRAAMFLTRVVVIPQILANYHQHGKNISGSRIPTMERIAARADRESKLLEELGAFLASQLDGGVDHSLRLDEWDSFHRNLLFWSYIFQGKRDESIDDYDIDSILQQSPPGPKNTIRKLLIALPPRIAQNLYRFWVLYQHLRHWSRSLPVRTHS